MLIAVVLQQLLHEQAAMLRNSYIICLLIVLLYVYVKVNADKTKYMVMSWDQTAGRRHRMKIDRSSFARVELFK
jgi:hypothetical protein